MNVDRFVSPAGLPTNAGTLDAPWSLAEVLNDPTRNYAQPGDTIHLRGGVYRCADRSPTSPGYVVHLVGTPEAPITVRNYERERATIDGGLTNKVKTISRHLRIMGLEVLVAEFATNRTTTQTGSHPTDLPLGGGLNFTAGHDIKLINNVVHQNRQGISFWQNVDGDSELYGNLVYDNGWIGADRRHGHGVYTQNAPVSQKLICDNFLFGNYGYNFHAYGSGTALVDRYLYERNAVFLSAAFPGRSGDTHFGGMNPNSNNGFVVRDNVNYVSKLKMGYVGLGGTGLVLTGNTVWKNILEIDVGYESPVVADNFVWNKAVPVGGVMPTGPRVFLNPNAYDPDLANVVILNFFGATSVSVPVANWLEAGDGYTLQRAEDFYGAPVIEGEYDGSGSILVPMAGDFFAGVLMADRQPCAAVIAERDALQIQLVTLTGQLNEASADRDRLTTELGTLNEQLAAVQLSHSSALADLGSIRTITDKWSV